MEHQEPQIPPFASGSDRARLAVIVFYVFFLVSVLSIISEFMEINILKRVIAGEEVPDSVMDSNDMRQLLFALLHTFTFWATIIFFLMWFHRAHRNLPALGAKELEYSPRWAVGGFFVPFMNLWRPYQVMREVWNACDPDMDDGISWKDMSPAPIVKWWWALFIVSIYVWDIAFRISIGAGETHLSRIEESWFWISAHAIDLPGILVAIHLIKQIDRWQEEKYNKILRKTNYSIE